LIEGRKARRILDTGYRIAEKVRSGKWQVESGVGMDEWMSEWAKEVGANLCVCPNLRLMIDNLIS